MTEHASQELESTPQPTPSRATTGWSTPNTLNTLNTLAPASPDPVVAVPFAGEALASIVYRHAHENGYTFASLIEHLHLARYMHTRSLDPVAATRVAAYFDLDLDQVHATTLESLPSQVVGTIDNAAAQADPFGWATVRWSNRCVHCHDEGRPWELLHQTALIWTCPRHNTYLTSHYRTLFTRGDVWNWDPPADTSNGSATQTDRADQQFVLELLADRQVEELRNLRAAAAIASIDLATRPPRVTGPSESDLSTAVLVGDTPTTRPGDERPQRVGRLGHKDLHYRFHRPHPDPATTGRHVRHALEHRLDDGTFDPDWVRSVGTSTQLTRQMFKLVAPYLVQLRVAPSLSVATTNSPFSSRTEQNPLAPGWIRLCHEFADAFRADRWERDHLPATMLLVEEDFNSPLYPSLARSVLVRQVIFGDGASRAVADCGGRGADITAVRRLLREPPTDTDSRAFKKAVSQLLHQPQIDQADLRRRQGAVRQVSDLVLRPLNLAAMGAGASDAHTVSRIAAVWLWTTVTGTHHRLAPFVDGRTVRPLIADLIRWRQAAAPEALIALLDWNLTHNLDPGVLTDVPNPLQVPHSTADGSASAHPKSTESA